LWNTQESSQMQAANGHGNTHGNLQDGEESPSRAANVSGADAEGDEDRTKPTGEEESVTHA
jgi:hypothetical protein